MANLNELIELLDQQCGDYRAMYSVGLKQRDCVEREDLTGLELAFTRMQELMDRVRLRQRRIPDLGDDRPALASRLETMRNLLYELEDLRSHTQAQAEKLLVQTRGEMRQMGQGRRAYRNDPGARSGTARLYDGVR
ncbi:MAG: hypothetical protein CMJ78_11620 [Planctomycetaceae bacterium]|nr:hypothetical protein [Planctomycetaceae bacterium]